MAACRWQKGNSDCQWKSVSGNGNDLFISFNYGKSFRSMKNPLDYSDKRGFGYHASFFWSEKENVLYYSNSIDYKDDLSKITFVNLAPKSRWVL